MVTRNSITNVILNRVIMQKTLKSESEMIEFGAMIGRLLSGGEMIELVGDVGAGKTTFTKGLAIGLTIKEDIQSPTFTISRVYDARDALHLAHYDFYRLNDAGIMTHELDEAINDPQTITVVEWGDVVQEILPKDRIQIRLTSPSIDDRIAAITAYGKKYEALIGNLT